MKNIEDILQDTDHRPWPLPSGRWQYYQEWNEALFLHWTVEESWLQAHVPIGYELDGFEGKFYISLVVFHMQKLRPRGLPALDFTSDFYQVNCRTYVKVGGKSGVYFLGIETGRKFVALLAGALSGLPYDLAQIQKKGHEYLAVNARKGREMSVIFQPGDLILEKSDLDIWLTEKYCLYKGSGQQVARYDVHHSEWELREIDLQKIEIQYPVFGKDLGLKSPDVIHYSEGVKAITWGKQVID